MSSIENYSRIWDGSSSGWVLLKINHQRTSLSVRFSAAEPSLYEIATLRKALPTLAKLSVAEVKSLLQGRQLFDIGSFESKEARGVANACRTHNLEVIEHTIDASGYLPFNEITKAAMIIKDNDLNRDICEEAIRRGVPVKHVEA